MPNDIYGVLVNTTQLDNALTATASAIREKTGSSDNINFDFSGETGFATAVSAIPTGTTPTGTKTINIIANGTTTEDVTAYANAEVIAAVPNTYSAGDEGKVVSSGALVAQSSATYSSNGEYDTTLINNVVVNVSGGGGEYSASDFLDLSKPVGRVVSNTTDIRNYVIYYRSGITSIYLTDYNGSLPQYAFAYCDNLKYFVAPGVTKLNSGCIGFNPRLEGIDISSKGAFAAADVIRAPNNNPPISSFTFIIRGDTLKAITNSNAFRGSPMNYNKPTTFYINKSVYDHLETGDSLDYAAATTWNTIYTRSNVTFAQIEGSIYETQYVDGTPIPTT